MISKVKEVWYAKGSYPDCNCIFTGRTKEELRLMLIEELIKMEHSRQTYINCARRKYASYCLQCEKEIVRLINELNSTPIE